MAFPTTPVLDNFNRADGPLTDSANWIGDGVSGDFDVVSNRIAAGGVGWTMDAWWASHAYTLPAEAYFTVPVVGAATSDTPFVVRVLGFVIDSTSYDQDFCCYQLIVVPNAPDLSTSTYRLGYGGNVGSPLGQDQETTGTIPIVAGDQWGLAVAISPIDATKVRMTGYRNGSAFATFEDTITNVNAILEGRYNGPGYLAPIVFSPEYAVDNFGGGQTTAPGSTVDDSILVRSQAVQRSVNGW